MVRADNQNTDTHALAILARIRWYGCADNVFLASRCQGTANLQPPDHGRETVDKVVAGMSDTLILAAKEGVFCLVVADMSAVCAHQTRATNFGHYKSWRKVYLLYTTYPIGT
jgi:hypothetical protein